MNRERAGQIVGAVIAVLSFVGVISSPVVGADGVTECVEGWSPREGILGIDGMVHRMIRWDADGAGPQREMLVFGGAMAQAGLTAVSNVVAWDGARWHALGDEPGSVNALLAQDGNLYAGFNTGGVAVRDVVGRVARWNGAAWEYLPGAFASGDSMFGCGVLALSLFNGRLVVGGGFTRIDELEISNIATWDGAAWQPLRGGADEAVFSMLNHNGALIVGGAFVKVDQKRIELVAKWDGTAWSDIGSGLIDDPQFRGFQRVYVLTEHQGDLYAGGDFFAGAMSGSGISRWDGEHWSLVGADFSDGPGADVLSFCHFEGDLIVGGTFNNAGNLNPPARRIARWDGQSWSAFSFVNTDLITAIDVYDGQLIAANSSERASASGVVVWEGQYWMPLGPGIEGRPTRMQSHGGSLYATGFITSADATPLWGAARWDGESWNSIYDPLHGWLIPLGAFQNDLIVSGGSHRRQPSTLQYVLRSNGTTIERLGDALFQGLGPALEFQGSLYMIAAFATGQIPSHRQLLRWNGAVWTPVTTAAVGLDVDLMTVYRNELIVTGQFSGDAGAPYEYIRGWDGTRWRSLGEGFSFPVRQLAVFRDRLIAAANTYEGGGQSAIHMARWDGQSWSAIDHLQSETGIYEITALSVHRDRLIVSGIALAPPGIEAAWGRVAT